MLPNLVPAKDIMKPDASINSLEASPPKDVTVGPLYFRNILKTVSSAEEKPLKKGTNDRRTKTTVDGQPVEQPATRKEAAKPALARGAMPSFVAPSSPAPLEVTSALQPQRNEPHCLTPGFTTIASAQENALSDVAAVPLANAESRTATESISSLGLNVWNSETSGPSHTVITPPAAAPAPKSGHIRTFAPRPSAKLSRSPVAARHELPAETPERGTALSPAPPTPVPTRTSGLNSEADLSAAAARPAAHEVESVTRDQGPALGSGVVRAEQTSDAPHPRVSIPQQETSQTAEIPAKVAFEARLRPLVAQMAAASVPVGPRSRPAASIPTGVNTPRTAVPVEAALPARQAEPQFENERQPAEKHQVKSQRITTAPAAPAAPPNEPPKPAGAETGASAKRSPIHAGQSVAVEAATGESIQNRVEFPAVQPALNAAISTDASQPSLPSRTASPQPQTVPETPATAATEPPQMTSAAPTPGPAGINIALNENGQRVELRVMERAGDIHVAVRTPDSQLATAMREQLPSLSSKLDQAGFHAEMWRPGASTAEHKIADSTGSGASSDGRQSSDERERRDGQQQHGNPRQQGQTRKTDRKEFSWLLDSIR